MAPKAGHVRQRIAHARRLKRPHHKNKRARPSGPRPSPDGDSLPARAQPDTPPDQLWLTLTSILSGTSTVVLLPPRPSWPRNRNRSTSTTMISSTTASTPPPPPPPVSTMVVRSRSTSSRSLSAMETLPDLLCYRGETNELLQARFRTGAGMRMIRLCVPVLTAALCACSANAPQQPERNETNHVARAPIANAADNVVLPD